MGLFSFLGRKPKAPPLTLPTELELVDVAKKYFALMEETSLPRYAMIADIVTAELRALRS